MKRFLSAEMIAERIGTALRAVCAEQGFDVVRWHKFRHPVIGCWFVRAFDHLDGEDGRVFEAPVWALEQRFADIKGEED